MPETELIKLCRQGDRKAFDELVKKYEKQVINIAYGMMSDREDALDAAQEVFVRVYRSIDSFKGNSSLSTWIYRITANVCNDILRKRQRSSNVISIDSSNDEDDKGMELYDDRATPEETAEKNERAQIIREAISELSVEYREIIIYCDIQGLSYDEISEILKCPQGTVKSRLNRARNALRKKLLKYRELF